MCFLTTINLTSKFQLMVHVKLSWRNCKCPVDLWQPGQIVLKKFHPSKNPVNTTKCSLIHRTPVSNWYSRHGSVWFPTNHASSRWSTHGWTMTNANHGISGSTQQNAALYTELLYQTNIQDMEVFVFPQTMEVHGGAHMGEPWPMLTMAYQAQHNKMQPYPQSSHIKLIQAMEVFVFPQTMEVHDGAHMGEPWPIWHTRLNTTKCSLIHRTLISN